MSDSWFKVRNINEIDSPALLVYLEKIKVNINYLKQLVPDVNRLRPHVKTHKMLEVVKLLMNEGIYKFKCATIAEAEMIAMAGGADVLLAHQPVGPKVLRLLSIVKKYPNTKFSCILDNLENAINIGKAFENGGFSIGAYVDLNVGMNRTGIKPGPGALDLYLNLDKIKGLRAEGLHAYDGHFRDRDILIRKKRCDEAFEKVSELVKLIEQKGKEKPLVVAGGTPTFPIHAQRNDVECSPGTFVFWDWGYNNALPELEFSFAALVISRVISIIDEKLLCLDLGHKAIAAENPLPRVHFLNIPDVEAISQSEEHLVIKVKSTSDFKLGDVLYGVPLHICPTCALYDYAYMVENEMVTDRWKVISRNRFIEV